MRIFVCPLIAFLALTGTVTQAAYDRGVPANYVENLLRGSSDDYFREMNSGWRDEQYAGLKAKITPGRSYIVIHNRLPSTPLDLRSGNGFRSSVKSMGLLNMTTLDIGHVMLGWHCENDGEILEGNTAITGEQENQQKAMASAGWGLTGLFSIFNDGHLQTPVLIGSVFRTHPKSDFMTLAYEVEPEQCRKMTDFIYKFVSAPNQPYKRFGLNADPLKFEGGGCGSFGASVVSASGTIDEIFPHMWRKMHVNNKVLGYGLPNLPPEIELFSFPKLLGPSHKVNQIKAMMVMNWDGKESDPYSRLLDPEMLTLMQKTTFRLSLDDVYRDSLRMGRFLMGSKLIQPRIVKQETMETRIDEKFDAKAAKTIETTKRWFKGMKARGFKAKGFEFAGHPAVLITR